MKINWKAVFSNPVIAAVWTAFAGAVAKQLYTAIWTGSFDWTQKSWVAMGTTGASAALLALLHLYMPAPTSNGPTDGTSNFPRPGIDYKVGALIVAAGFGFLAHYRRLFMSIALVSGSLAVCMFLTGCGQLDWLNDVINIVPVLVAGATSLGSLIAALTGNAIAAEVLVEVSAWQVKVEAGLKNLESLIAAYKATPGETTLEQVEAVAQLLVSDLSSFSTIVGVPPALGAKIQAVAQLLLSAAESVLSAIPVVKVAATAAKSTSPVSVPAFTLPVSSGVFKQQFNALLKAPTGDPDTDTAAAAAKTI